MKVIRNTYPIYPNVHRANPGDTVHWENRGSKGMALINENGNCVFSTPAVGQDGVLNSSQKLPTLTGVIAQVKSKGWVLEIG